MDYGQKIQINPGCEDHNNTLGYIVDDDPDEYYRFQVRLYGCGCCCQAKEGEVTLYRKPLFERLNAKSLDELKRLERRVWCLDWNRDSLAVPAYSPLYDILVALVKAKTSLIEAEQLCCAYEEKRGN